jgi:hypothetical protein
MRTMGDLEVREEKHSAEIRADLSLQGEAIFILILLRLSTNGKIKAKDEKLLGLT